MRGAGCLAALAPAPELGPRAMRRVLARGLGVSEGEAAELARACDDVVRLAPSLEGLAVDARTIPAALVPRAGLAAELRADGLARLARALQAAPTARRGAFVLPALVAPESGEPGVVLLEVTP